LPGAHTFGQGFGVARKGHSHQGQDIFAPCGSPLISVSAARVIMIGVQGSAGNYLVIRNSALHHDYVYAHMAAPAPLVKGQILTAGQPVGNVGQTGNARGCHLHFELWAGKYYRGGRAVNPRAALQLWDSYS
jgi:murein DD-endopeptidase MepM/ murein hydrolase activator NlpD